LQPMTTSKQVAYVVVPLTQQMRVLPPPQNYQTRREMPCFYCDEKGHHKVDNPYFLEHLEHIKLLKSKILKESKENLEVNMVVVDHKEEPIVFEVDKKAMSGLSSDQTIGMEALLVALIT